jgi:hypothetical protein
MPQMVCLLVPDVNGDRLTEEDEDEDDNEDGLMIVCLLDAVVNGDRVGEAEGVEAAAVSACFHRFSLSLIEIPRRLLSESIVCS